MIELEVVNNGNSLKAVKLCLPEDPDYLRQQLKAIGVGENNYEITKIRCYPGNLEKFIRKHDNIQRLNHLALRLKRLPVSALYEAEAFLETISDRSLAQVFCFLDQWEKPGHLEEAAVYLPAALQMIILEHVGTDAYWQKRFVSVKEAADMLEIWNTQFHAHAIAEEGLRRLAYYLTEEALKKLVFSMEPELVILEDTLYLKFVCQVKRKLTEEEAQHLQKGCLDLCQVSWGRSFFTKTVLGDGRRMSLSVSNLGARLLYPDATDAIQKPVLWQKEAVLTMDVYGNEQHGEEREVLFTLPATYWSFQDLLYQLGADDEAELFSCFVDCPRLPVFSDWLWSQTEQGGVLGTLGQWNTLAMLLDEFDLFAEKRLEALAEAMEERRMEELSEVVGLVLWVRDGVLLEDILDDAALGKFCLESGYLRDQAWFLEQMKGYLDYNRIGKRWRESDGGLYTRIGYLSGGVQPKEVSFWKPTPPKEAVSVSICLEDPNGANQVVSFPKDQEAVSDQDWQKAVTGAACVVIDCMAPVLIPVIYEDLLELEHIKTLGRRLMELEQAGELPKFQAMLELWNEPDLEGALAASYQLEAYQYFGDCRSAHSLGLMLFQLQYGLELTEEEKKTIDFSRYGKRRAARVGAIETSYGYLLPEGV